LKQNIHGNDLTLNCWGYPKQPSSEVGDYEVQRELLLFPMACGERGMRSGVYVCMERGTSGSNLTTSAYGSDQLPVGWHDVSFLKK